MLLAALMMMCLFAGCDSKEDDGPSANDSFPLSSEVVVDEASIDLVITEEDFADTVYEIYMNADKYIGKTLRIQGMSQIEFYNGQSYHSVYRNCPCSDGSHEYDQCGMEYLYTHYPEDGTWVDIVGVLTSYEEEGQQYLTIAVKSISIMEQPGKEVVSNADVTVVVSGADVASDSTVVDGGAIAVG